MKPLKQLGPIDVHCHFFNKEILSLRLLIELGMHLKLRGQRDNQGLNSVISPLKRALHFFKTGMLPVEKIYQSLEKDESEFAFCPLMFDLEGCMIASGVGNDCNIIQSRQQVLEEVRLLLLENQDSLDDFRELSELLNKEDMQELQAYDHFAKQEQQLCDLVMKYPDRIYPFFAIDPRRKELFDNPEKQLGINKIISRLRLNGGLFSGIKLYTPNGYSPSDERLLPLYEYCQSYQIPITAHCSASGFASFAPSIDVRGAIYENGKVVEKKGIYKFEHNGLIDMKRVEERARILNHPKIWEQLLQQYPALKLNLAHFGAQDVGKQTEWTDCIRRMMDIYPNLYTDLSCISVKSELEMMHRYYQDAPETVKSRFLYGSDYYLNILFIDDMKCYWDNFSDLFDPDELKTITEVNPITFLNNSIY